ncbi:MAG TPA: alcohol dehydrogenase catalytic domain-containing protein [Nitrososphaerales archaeon]|nr:alcohol dehydrogenase catalytic domain-containing protein [Nitrososphaerales archaeon]
MGEKKEIRAAFVKSGGGVELRTVSTPIVEDGSILISMKASGVCGTDLEKLTGQSITSTILGHEVSGIVIESRANNFEQGDRVIPHHHVSCNECELCLRGAQTMCQKYKNSNFTPGGFADEFLLPAYNVKNGGIYKISESLSFEEASFAEPLGCCIRGLSHAGVVSDGGKSRKQLRNALVVGAGPIGLLHMELLRSTFPDLKLSTVDMIGSRLEFAEKNEIANIVDAGKIENGAFSESCNNLVGPLGYDLVIVATGSEKAFRESIKCVRKSGTLLLFGVPHKGATHSLDLAKLLLDELTITSSYATSETELRQAIELLEHRIINVKKFITSTYPLEKVDEAMSAARSENQVKVLVMG